MSVSPKLTKLHGLDHLRALAILFVLLFHYRIFAHPAWMDDAFSFGWTGVDLFFVLSGFLIASQLFARIARDGEFNLKEFFIKRFFRIIPLYLVILAIYFLFPAFREREGLAPLWRYLTFTQNIGLDLSLHGTFSHAWSLCIEEQFYLAFPLVILLMLKLRVFRKSAWLLLSLLLFGVLIRYYLYHADVKPWIDQDGFWIRWYKYIYYPTWNRLDGLLAGVGLAALMQFRPRAKKWIIEHGNQLMLAGVAVLAGAWFLEQEQTSFLASVVGYPVISLGFGLLVAGAVSPSTFLYRYASILTSKLAALSYALYLSHKIVIHLVQQGMERMGVDTTSHMVWLTCLLACLSVAWALNEAIEKPFLKMRDRVLQPKTHSHNPASSSH